jgi:thiol-disulfide isomerase/thioredoxin
MKKYDISHVQSWQKNLEQTVSLNFFVRQKDSTDPFYRYGNILDTECSNIHIEYTKTDALPKIQLNKNLHFHSIPEGSEIQPFIKSLTYKTNPPKMTAEYLGVETLPTSHLTLFVSPYCHNCPLVLQKVLPIAWLNPNIDLTIIDVGLFPDEAETHNIQSVPSLIYKDFRWTGPVTIAEILDVIQNSPDQWDVSSLERLLSEGKAIQLAQSIIDNGSFTRNFYHLIAHELLSVRLGAMVCVEHIVENNRFLAKTLCKNIWPLLSKANVQVRGDLLYLIGICGTQQDIPKLKEIETQSAEIDIKEAISEAIQTIQEQS